LVVPNPKNVKMRPKTIDFVFIEYVYNSSAYQFLIYKSSIENIHFNTIIESRNVIFFENVFSFKKIQENHLLKKMIEASLSSHR
jgi:hypothetical protein